MGVQERDYMREERPDFDDSSDTVALARTSVVDRERLLLALARLLVERKGSRPEPSHPPRRGRLSRFG